MEDVKAAKRDGWEIAREIEAQKPTIGDRAVIEKEKWKTIAWYGIAFVLLFAGAVWLAGNPFEFTQRLPSAFVKAKGWMGTDQWAIVSLAGPHARDLLAELCPDADLSAEGFRFFSMQEGTVAGVAARILRVSFSGELCFEVSVPADYGLHLWEAAMAAGEKYGATPYGTETMHVLRAEKGFIIVGQDTDGSVTPMDLGMGAMVSAHKDCLGKRSLSRPDLVREDRKQLVGLLPEDPQRVIPEGAQLVRDPDHPVPVPMEGHVTSSYYGARLGRSFALAMVAGGRERMDERLFAWTPETGPIAARIAGTVFFDPEGERQNV